MDPAARRLTEALLTIVKAYLLAIQGGSFTPTLSHLQLCGLLHRVVEETSVLLLEEDN